MQKSINSKNNKQPLQLHEKVIIAVFSLCSLICLFTLIFLSGCSHSSDLREIRRTSDELHDLWWRSERWADEFKEL